MTDIMHTERLRLRTLTLNDLDFVATMLADPDVMRHYPRCYTRAEAHQWIERQLQRYATDGHGLWLVERRVDGQPIGQVGLMTQVVAGTAHPEIGYLVHRPYWRRGYATETARGVRDYAFEVLEYDHVISLIRPVNRPSQGVALNVGMHVLGDCEFKGYRHLIFGVKAAEHTAWAAVTAENIRGDKSMMACLRAARSLALPDWYLAAGFLRNAIWDWAHDRSRRTPLNDIDLVYYDNDDCSPEWDAALTRQLNDLYSAETWEVKNQARMHQAHGHPPYQDTIDAIRHWVEIPTCVGVRLTADDRLQFAAPFGLWHNWSLTVRHNFAFHQHPAIFQQRVTAKKWSAYWPQLTIDSPVPRASRL